MQDQGKKLLYAVGAALAFMLLWNTFFGPKKDDQGAGSGSAVASGSAGTPSVGPVAAPSTVGQSIDQVEAQPSAMTPVPKRGTEQKIVLKFPRFTATFSSYGGALVSWKLADPRYERDATKGELMAGKPNTGAFYVDFAKSTYVVPPGAEWTGTQVSDTQVKYALTTDTMQLEKTFTVTPDAFLLKMVVTAKFTVPAGKIATQQLAIMAYQFQNVDESEKGKNSYSMARAWASSTLADGSIKQTPIKDVIEWPRYEQAITWAGYEHAFLLEAFAPRPALAGEYTVEKHARALPEETGLMRTDLVYVPAQQVKTGDAPITREVVAYLGPKNYTSLGKADDGAGFDTSFKKAIDLGWFGFIGKPLLWLLQQFYAFFGNWGVSIILLTFLVKAATLYWTTKSMRSMKAMSVLTPQMKALQEKYKDDKQRQQVETMALYKKHNVNPIAGCLPMLLQMPIWLALYRMLSTAGELYQQPFIHGWMDDLTAPDPTHILPIALVITMFLQARLNPQTGTSGQQKMIQYGMPLMFGVMSFFFPAGLTIYMFTNTVLSAIHSVYMNRYDTKSLEMMAKMKESQAQAEAEKAALEAKVAGKGGKKPKVTNGASKAKPVIDVESVETTTDDDDEEAAASAESGSSATQPRPRNKKKKRRR